MYYDAQIGEGLQRDSQPWARGVLRMPDGGAEARELTAEGATPMPPGRGVFFKALLFIVIVFAIAILIYQFAFGPMSWGREGELELAISLANDTMPLDGSIKCSYVLANTGDSDLRILRPYLPSLVLFDSNNTTVRWVGPVAEPPPPDTNDDLVTIRAGESWSVEVVISASWWDLRANETYRVVATYRSREESRVTLPYWEGELSSNEVYFTVEA